MKAFIISICTITLIFGVIIWNFFYINNIYVYMTDTVTEFELNEESVKKAEALWEYWKRKSVIIALSIPHRVSDELEKNLVILQAKLRSGSDFELDEAKALTLNSIEEMRIHASASFDSVF